MEELLGLIIFGVIAAISGLAKLMEKRKEEAQRSERPSPQRVEDLPEATRRMLYGDAPPPVARKRGEGPPLATPRQAPPVPQRRPVPQSAPPRQAAPQQHAPMQRQQAPTPPPVPQQRRPVPPQQTRPQQPAPQRRSAPQTPRQGWQQPQQAPQRPQSQPAQAPREAPRTASSRPVDAERSSSARRRRKQASIKALLHHPKTLKTSIILHEVLSPPKSMR